MAPAVSLSLPTTSLFTVIRIIRRCGKAMTLLSFTSPDEREGIIESQFSRNVTVLVVTDLATVVIDCQVWRSMRPPCVQHAHHLPTSGSRSNKGVGPVVTAPPAVLAAGYHRPTTIPATCVVSV